MMSLHTHHCSGSSTMQKAAEVATALDVRDKALKLAHRLLRLVASRYHTKPPPPPATHDASPTTTATEHSSSAITSLALARRAIKLARWLKAPAEINAALNTPDVTLSRLMLTRSALAAVADLSDDLITLRKLGILRRKLPAALDALVWRLELLVALLDASIVLARMRRQRATGTSPALALKLDLLRYSADLVEMGGRPEGAALVCGLLSAALGTEKAVAAKVGTRIWELGPAKIKPD